MQEIQLVSGLYRVGDRVRFDHFGAKERPGMIVKITAIKIYVQWTAPSSGVTRTVPLRYHAWPGRDNEPTQVESAHLIKEG